MRIPIEDVLAEHPVAAEIIGRLERAGYDTVLVGGVVRDGVRAVLEGRRWIPEDLDIATAAPPERVHALLPEFKVLEVGRAYGVMIVVAPGGQQYEVATFRTESAYADGRHPRQVRWGTLEEDVRRRDFTVNGLAATREGEVLDLVGGLADLKAEVIRTIGPPDARFSEDWLRLLRAVRFSCQLGFALAEETEAAVRRQAEGLAGVSWERIRDELLRLLASPRSAGGVRLLQSTGLLCHTLPEVAALEGVPQPAEYHPEGDVFAHTCAALAVADGLWDEPLLKLAVMLHDVGKPVSLAHWEGEHMSGHCQVGGELAECALRRLRLPTRQVAWVVRLVREHMRAARLQEMRLGKQLRLLGAEERAGEPLTELPRRYPLFADLLRLIICDAEGSSHKASTWRPLLAHVVALLLHLERIQGLERARELLRGDDLLAMGAAPGPQLGKVLEEVHELILAGTITSRKQALQEATRRLAGQT
ncbi:MAG: CCA tRNA nucleotidyltransferase [Candidatus Bipolaricaulota bacterium]